MAGNMASLDKRGRDHFRDYLRASGAVPRTAVIRRAPAPGWRGWIATGLVIALAEWLDERTMSDAFSNAAKRPVLGPCIWIGWGYLSAHLLGVLPKKYDVLHQGAKRAFPGRYRSRYGTA